LLNNAGRIKGLCSRFGEFAIMTNNDSQLREFARQIRRRVLEMSHRAGTPHLGSSLSCADIVAAAYGGGLRLAPADAQQSGRDRFLLSKGHAATTLYAALALTGHFPDDWISHYAEPGAPLGEHPSPEIPGIDLATGSLGHGLPVAVGLALSDRIRRVHRRTCVLMSDGECNEGTVWEAALFAPAHRLVELFVVIDFNGWQATGRSAEITALEPLAEKWATFGWRTIEIDGHDLIGLRDLLAGPADGSGRPTAIVAHTVKGKGVSFMEDDNNWHYRVPNDAELARALAELEAP
jgi:transketolase